jgi:hypothetical protein
MDGITSTCIEQKEGLRHFKPSTAMLAAGSNTSAPSIFYFIQPER